MSWRKALGVGLPILIVVLLAGVGVLMAYYADLPQRVSQHETIVLGQNRLVPGSSAGLRVVVRDSKDGAPLPGAEVKVALAPSGGGRATTLFTGVSDEAGNLDVSFLVPADADPDQTLVVETSSRLGSDRLEQSVTLARDYRVLLTSDKPLYQPGQVIHLRALALGTFDLRPAAGAPLEVVIADAKGNKVFRETLTTSEYGVAAVDFELADQVNTGRYNISASLGNTTSEKTVTVERYVLPKFEVTITTERPFYLPGEHVQGSLSGRYFYGKVVDGGEVTLEGYTFDFERVDVFSRQGTTDEEGVFQFEFDLPSYIAGTDLEGGAARFYLQATVTDKAQHSEFSQKSLPVSGSRLVIEAVPEGGQFRPGVENLLYVLTSYPDGTPAETRLQVWFDDIGERAAVETGRYGLAEIPFTPSRAWGSVSIEAVDASGAKASRQFYFEGGGMPAEGAVLLRPDRPIYRVGDVMQLTVLTSQAEGTVYLDMVREGQTVSTRAVPVSGGRAEVAVDLTPDLYGTLELHAYKIIASGSIVRDTRLVVVDAASDLALSLTPDHEVYLPGETAGLDIQVSGAEGAAVPAAVGLAVVDEAVFALAEQDPGFAKLYFMLEQELLEPKYDLHGFSVPDFLGVEPVSDPQLRLAQEGAAKASLAEAAMDLPAFSLQANSHEQAVRNARDLRATYLGRVGAVLLGFVVLIPLVIMGLTVTAVWRQGNFWRSLGLAVGALVAFAAVSFVLILLAMWVAPVAVVGGFALVGLAIVALIGLIVLTIRRRDPALGWTLGLLSVLLAVLVMSVYATEEGDFFPSDPVVLAGLIALLLVPLAFLIRFGSFRLAQDKSAAWAALGTAALVVLLPVSLPVVAGAPLMAVGGVAAPAAFRGNLAGDVMWELAPGEVMELPEVMLEKEASLDSGQGAEPPRLRQYFPETMLWLPDLVTDQDGALHLDFPVADSITTWRMTALASSQDGRLGSTTAGLRVFQDFFIDLDLPLALTVGDEVAVPVGVFNYLPESQQVRLELAPADWFELLGEGTQEMTIAANDISVAYFRVRALDFGRHPFQVTAWGSAMSDAIMKEVQVYPNGKQVHFTYSDRLTAGEPVQQTVNIPSDAIAGTQELAVKIYPGVVSQVVEGLDSILRMPYGCFEQTSSTTYPNVLVLDYLRTTNQASPEVQFTAEEYINLGYQRLTTFEVGQTGGFSLFGESPADRMLTAYGLQEFSDMSRVHNVDPALVSRAADWLLSQQASDGSWENDRGLVHESSWSNLQNDRLPVTAYVVWSLVEAGYSDDARTQDGLSYVREFQGQADDPYVVALVANALVAADRAAGGDLSSVTLAVLDRLAGMAVQEGNGAIWSSGVATFMGSEGQTGSIETTALAALAFLRAGSHADLANAALTALVQQKDSFGTWYSTQATVLSLKALIESVRAGAEQVDAAVTVTLNGGQARTVRVTPENFDVVQMIAYDDVRPGADNVVALAAEGEGNLMYQVAGSYYLPWEKLPLYPEVLGGDELVTIELAYDRTELAVDDTVTVDVAVSLNEPGRAEWALIDLGIPPGFVVQADDLAALVARFDDIPEDYAFPTVERYELTGRQILVYVGNLSDEHALTFSYRLRAKYPLRAQTPASSVYDYYNPEVSGEAQPLVLVVTE
jgi:hypothetical protein